MARTPMKTPARSASPAAPKAAGRTRGTTSSGVGDGTYEQPAAADPYAVIGTLGLKQASGMIWEEFDPKLRGQNAVRVYTAMARGDATCGAILWAIESVLRGVEWEVEPAKEPGEADPSEQAIEVADFVRTVLFEGMKTGWPQIIAEALSCLAFGYSLHEVVWQKREDGRIGIDDVQPRPQDTLLRWTFDDNGAVTGYAQRHPVNGSEVIIPAEKSLHFRVRHWKRDPEGVSILRTGYQSWVYATNLSNIEAIGLERDLAGLPVARMPMEIMAKAQTGDPVAQAQVNAYASMVRDLRLNQQSGVVLPSDCFPSPDGSGVTAVRMYDLTLLSAPSGRSSAADTAIKRHKGDLATSVLADFLMLGQGATGSWALSTDKTELFLQSLEAINQSLASEAQRGLVVPLCAFNGIPDELRPMVRPGAVAPMDLAKLASNIGILAAAGARMFPDTKLENVLRQKMGLPPLDESNQERDGLADGVNELDEDPDADPDAKPTVLAA